MIYFNQESMRLFSESPDGAPSIGTLLKKYAQQNPGCEVAFIVEMFQQRFERSITTIDSDHASYTFSQEQIERVLSALGVKYIRIY